MNKFKLGELAQLAEIVAAFAVVLSLVYVGLEIRQSTLESDADIQEELLSYTRQRRILVVENSELAQVLTKGYSGVDSLTAAENLQFVYFSELHYVAWERAFVAKDSGVFSEKMWKLWDDWFASTARAEPDFVWPIVRNTLHSYPAFVLHVNTVMGIETSD
jgi:hypothetical protein